MGFHLTGNNTVESNEAPQSPVASVLAPLMDCRKDLLRLTSTRLSVFANTLVPACLARRLLSPFTTIAPYDSGKPP